MAKLVEIVLCVSGSFTVSAAAMATTFSIDIKPILDGNCVECHGHGARDPDLSAFPFGSTTMPDQSTIVGTIVSETQGASPHMPPGVRTKLTADQISLIQQWQQGGLKP